MVWYPRWYLYAVSSSVYCGAKKIRGMNEYVPSHHPARALRRAFMCVSTLRAEIIVARSTYSNPFLLPAFSPHQKMLCRKSRRGSSRPESGELGTGWRRRTGRRSREETAPGQPSSLTYLAVVTPSHGPGPVSAAPRKEGNTVKKQGR